MPHRQRHPQPQPFDADIYYLWFDTKEKAQELIWNHFEINLEPAIDKWWYMDEKFPKPVSISVWGLRHILDTMEDYSGPYHKIVPLPAVFRQFYFPDRG